MVASVSVPGEPGGRCRSRPGVFVNIADPPEIASIRASAVVGRFAVPDRGPHGLDIDDAAPAHCACDGGMLVALDADTGDVRARSS
jgi:hypothetical protein